MRTSSKFAFAFLLTSFIALPVAAFADDAWDDDGPPATSPPPPPMAPAPPMASERLPPPQYAPQQQVDGQWVYTNQYGWTWIPYSRDYTYVDPDGTVAYSYVYYPSAGWSWVLSPWVLGYGPGPRWGTYGYSRFAWHSRPWFRVGPRWAGPGWAGHYANGRVVVHTSPAPRQYRQAPRQYSPAPTVVVRPQVRQRAPTVIVRPQRAAPPVVGQPAQPAPPRNPGRAPPRGPGHHGDRGGPRERR